MSKELLEQIDSMIERIALIELHTGETKSVSIDKHTLLDIQKELELKSTEIAELKKVLETIKKHFIIKFEEDDVKGDVWGRLISIQSKEDEGDWDTTACANIVDYKEDFELLKRYLGNE